MTRALALKQKQVTALCKGAEKAGHIAVVVINGVEVRLIPAEHVIHRPGPVDEDEDWRL